ncbi:MAG TPA: homoserine dehydrogenase [Bacillota bacterium]
MALIGLLGLGTVGTGVVEVLTNNREDITRRAGEPITIGPILVRETGKARAIAPELVHLTTDPAEVVTAPDVDIVVEAMGGTIPALTYIQTALAHGKHVVTANKEVVSEHGQELFEAAAANRCHLLFEASVGGGIPLITPLKRCLAANEIDEVSAIINGTTNYILTEMAVRKKDFNEVLREAQALGYAETDPSADVDGLDAARKLAIMASIVFNTRITPGVIRTEGIRRVSRRDTEVADELGCVIKLVATARQEEARIFAAVSPTLLPRRNPLAFIDGVQNAVLVRGRPVGQVMFAGPGAGRGATASAVVGDIMEIVRSRTRPTETQCTCFSHKAVAPAEESVSRFYLRLEAPLSLGPLNRLSKVFSAAGVALEALTDRPIPSGRSEVVIVTRPAREMDVRAAATECALSERSIVVESLLRMAGDAGERANQPFFRSAAATR